MDSLQEKITNIALAADWDSDEDETFHSAIEEIRAEAISAFAFDRLQSYYKDHQDIREAPLRALERSRALAKHDPSAALVFAITAAEVCIKNLILRPMVYGFVHQAYAAQFVADLAVSQMGWDRFRDLLTEILREKVGIDLTKVALAGTTTSLWAEFNKLVTVRNGVVHRAEGATPEHAETAIHIAEELINVFFPKLLAGIGLQIADNGFVATSR